jgi:2-isopropylmalate synthase
MGRLTVDESGTTRIHIYDTTLRDGTQREGLSLSVDDKVKIAVELDELGIDYIEGGWPGSNPKDAEFFRRAATYPFRHAKLAAFGSTRHAANRCEDDPNIQALVAAQTPVTTIVGKSSVLHVERVLETTRESNLRMIGESVSYLKSLGREVIYDAEHFFDGYRLDPAYALATLEAAAGAGADCVVLCDTNGGTLPDEIARIVELVRMQVDTAVGIHPHNDSGVAVANALAAVQAGCTHVQGTINGYGERCGNLDLIPTIANLQVKRGYQCVPADQVRRLTEVSHLVAAVANVNPDAHAPYVGRSAFAHKGGIHVAAVRKVAESYEHVAPDLVGNETRVVVSELSGRQNVRMRAEALGLKSWGNEVETLRRIKELESRGFQFEAADGSFEMLIRRAAPDYRPPFELLEFRVIDEKRGPEEAPSQATVKLKVGFGIERDVANLRALRDALGQSAELMVDANQAWSLEEASGVVAKFEPFALSWLEEPLRADRPWSEWRALAGRTGMPLAAGENLASESAFDDALRSGALGVVQPDIANGAA